MTTTCPTCTLPHAGTRYIHPDHRRFCSTPCFREGIKREREEEARERRKRIRRIAPAPTKKNKLSNFTNHELAHGCRIASTLGHNASFKAAMLEAAAYFEKLIEESESVK